MAFCISRMYGCTEKCPAAVFFSSTETKNSFSFFTQKTAIQYSHTEISAEPTCCLIKFRTLILSKYLENIDIKNIILHE